MAPPSGLPSSQRRGRRRGLPNLPAPAHSACFSDPVGRPSPGFAAWLPGWLLGWLLRAWLHSPAPPLGWLPRRQAAQVAYRKLNGELVMGHGGGGGRTGWRAVSRMEQPKRAGSPLVPLAHKRVSKPAPSKEVKGGPQHMTALQRDGGTAKGAAGVQRSGAGPAGGHQRRRPRSARWRRRARGSPLAGDPPQGLLALGLPREGARGRRAGVRMARWRRPGVVDPLRAGSTGEREKGCRSCLTWCPHSRRGGAGWARAWAASPAPTVMPLGGSTTAEMLGCSDVDT